MAEGRRGTIRGRRRESRRARPRNTRKNAKGEEERKRLTADSTDEERKGLGSKPEDTKPGGLFPFLTCRPVFLLRAQEEGQGNEEKRRLSAESLSAE